MNLDIDGKESYFYNAAKFKKDSVYAATKDYKVLSEFTNFDRNLTYTIHKTYSPKSIQFYDKFQTANLVIKEENFRSGKFTMNLKKSEKSTVRMPQQITEVEAGQLGSVKNIL